MAFKKVEPSPNATTPPIQYQRGWSEFYKLKFNLTSDVLIPRPETELLVDEVLKFSSLVPSPQPLTIMDIGTGSGCIAISIAKNLKDARIIATDISKDALKVAQKNADTHHVNKKVVFVEQDLLGTLKVAPDIIVTNLPYIPGFRLMMIDPLVRDFEPKLALDGGSDGFDIYRRLFNQMNDKKIYPKILIAEIDEEQGENAKLEVKRFFPKAKEIEVKKDLFGKDRILIINF